MSWNVPAPDPATRAALERFQARALAAFAAAGDDPPRQTVPADWPSPCVLGPADERGRVPWRPRLQADCREPAPVDFRGLASALERNLPAALVAWYGSYWSDGFVARAEEGGLLLLQLWNPQDFDRLVGNLIGHALARRRARERLSYFFATTDDPDLMLTLDAETAAVLLEPPGFPALRQVAPDLPSFLDRLDPVAEPFPWD